MRTSITWKEIISKLTYADTSKGAHTFSCGSHLYVRVTGRQHNAAWYVRTKDGKFVRLGEFGSLSLSSARKKALEQYNQIEKQSGGSNQLVLFGELAQQWLNTKQHLIRFANYRRCTDILSGLNNIPVAEVKISTAKEVLFSQDLAPYMMHEAIAVLCRIMDLAIENEIIDSHNFAVLRRSQLIPKLQRTEGFAWKPVEQFGELMADILNCPPIYQVYFVLLPMLCLRPGECLKLKFSYFDINERILKVPGELMKIKRKNPFRVPLTDYTVKLYLLAQSLITFKNQEYLFVKQRAPEPPQLGRFSGVWRANVGSAAHLHGFRKSARSWMSEHQVSYEVAAKCLDHDLNLGADVFYQKSDLYDLRRPVMEAWNKAVYDNLPDQLKQMLDKIKLN